MANQPLTPDNAKNIIREYCDCLLKNDFDRIMQLFASKAFIKSPFLNGEKNANDFFTELFKTSKRLRVDIKNVFCDIEKDHIFAAYLDYEGISKEQQYVRRFIDIFEFDDCSKIKKITIIREETK